MLKEDIPNWMLNDELKLNDYKTKFMIIGTSQQLLEQKYLLIVPTQANLTR